MLGTYGPRMVQWIKLNPFPRLGLANGSKRSPLHVEGAGEVSRHVDWMKSIRTCQQTRNTTGRRRPFARASRRSHLLQPTPLLWATRFLLREHVVRCYPPIRNERRNTHCPRSRTNLHILPFIHRWITNHSIAIQNPTAVISLAWQCGLSPFRHKDPTNETLRVWKRRYYPFTHFA